ncbi:hypothetical protein HK103_001010 [Boothiomyces macroporosus]|uniref:Uncharacterized protein n=1 Tax=Boothiomyces macroporosus TaxID=261099 RepID=A0AAD5UB95_9FUNG|nr:hypothetical protein HK103_001010 [Boothiomyces macroporosus]
MNTIAFGLKLWRKTKFGRRVFDSVETAAVLTDVLLEYNEIPFKTRFEDFFEGYRAKKETMEIVNKSKAKLLLEEKEQKLVATEKLLAASLQREDALHQKLKKTKKEADERAVGLAVVVSNQTSNIDRLLHKHDKIVKTCEQEYKNNMHLLHKATEQLSVMSAIAQGLRSKNIEIAAKGNTQLKNLEQKLVETVQQLSVVTAIASGLKEKNLELVENHTAQTEALENTIKVTTQKLSEVTAMAESLKIQNNDITEKSSERVKTLENTVAQTAKQLSEATGVALALYQEILEKEEGWEKLQKQYTYKITYLHQLLKDFIEDSDSATDSQPTKDKMVHQDSTETIAEQSSYDT